MRYTVDVVIAPAESVTETSNDDREVLAGGQARGVGHGDGEGVAAGCVSHGAGYAPARVDRQAMARSALAGAIAPAAELSEIVSCL